MRVWIDQDLCTGDGLCMDHCPEVFVLLEDGIAYVREDRAVLNDPGGAASLAAVPGWAERAVVAAAEDCPGESLRRADGRRDGVTTGARTERPGRAAGWRA